MQTRQDSLYIDQQSCILWSAYESPWTNTNIYSVLYLLWTLWNQPGLFWAYSSFLFSITFSTSSSLLSVCRVFSTNFGHQGFHIAKIVRNIIKKLNYTTFWCRIQWATLEVSIFGENLHYLECKKNVLGLNWCCCTCWLSWTHDFRSKLIDFLNW